MLRWAGSRAGKAEIPAGHERTLRAVVAGSESANPRTDTGASRRDSNRIGSVARDVLRMLPATAFRPARGHRRVPERSRRSFHADTALRREGRRVARCGTGAVDRHGQNAALRRRPDRRRCQRKRPRPGHGQPDRLRRFSGHPDGGLARMTRLPGGIKRPTRRESRLPGRHVRPGARHPRRAAKRSASKTGRPWSSSFLARATPRIHPGPDAVRRAPSRASTRRRGR